MFTRSTLLRLVLALLLVVVTGGRAVAQPVNASVASTGAQGNGASLLTSRDSMSRWARAVVFASDAANLVAGDTNGVRDVFVRDLVTMATARVSVGVFGAQANGPSGGFYGPNGNLGCTISGNGRHVAFTSLASNLVTGDSPNTLDVFVHDRDADMNLVLDERGGTRTTMVGRTRDRMPDGRCYEPSLSHDGRYVAFVSEAGNLIQPTGTSSGSAQIYVFDRDRDGNGRFDDATPVTMLISLSTSGPGDGHSRRPVISGDGLALAYESAATNLVGGDTNGSSDIFFHDRRTRRTSRVSVTSIGAQANGDSVNASASWDARWIAFESYATNLVDGDTNGVSDIFVHDRATRRTVRVSVSSSEAQANGASFNPSITDDGRFVTFVSGATNLVAGSGRSRQGVFLHDRDADGDGFYDEAGAVSTIFVGPIGFSGPVTEPLHASIDPAGTAVSFTGRLPLSAADTNNAWDIAIESTALSADTDGDGLLDVWETSGVDADGDGRADLILTNANPLHKDLYVEVDWMTEDINGNGVLDSSSFYDMPEDLNGNGVIDSRPLLPQAQTALVNAFAAVPNFLAGNPDGLPGITLHLVVDDRVPFPLPATAGQLVGPFGVWPTNPWPSFAIWKRSWFGTQAERQSGNFANARFARQMTHRYCIFGDRIGATSIGGFGELFGNDFMVTLGAWPIAGGTWQQQAGVFMHELGHNLGLEHGGQDSINFKPNYHSVMNYTWSVPAWVPGLPANTCYAGSWRLDFSRSAPPALDESSLNEPAGISGIPGSCVPYGPQPPALAPGTGSVDWDRSGFVGQARVRVDINDVVPASLTSPGTPIGPGQMLVGLADWANLAYPLAGNANFGSGVSGHITPGGEEISHEIVEALAHIGLERGRPVRDLVVAGRGASVEVRWENPAGTGLPEGPIRIRANGREVAVVSRHSTSSSLGMADLDPELNTICVVNGSGTPVCASFHNGEDLFVNCGGPRLDPERDTGIGDGRVWHEDSFQSPSPFLARSSSNQTDDFSLEPWGTIAVVDTTLVEPDFVDDPVRSRLFATERWSDGELIYRIPVPEGEYDVTLLFAEGCCSDGCEDLPDPTLSAGACRVADLRLNGEPVAERFAQHVVAQRALGNPLPGSGYGVAVASGPHRVGRTGVIEIAIASLGGSERGASIKGIAIEGVPSGPDPETCCDAPYNVGFSARALGGDDAFADVAGDAIAGDAIAGDAIAGDAIDRCSSDGGTIALTSSVGDSAPVFVNIASAAPSGVAGWSLSVEVSGDLDVAGVSTAGTLAARVTEGGMLRDGFSESQVIDPERNDGRRGVVSAVVLSFTTPLTLPPVGVTSVLRVDLASGDEVAERTTGLVSFTDNLVGKGQPVANVLTVAGQSAFPCNLETASATVVLERARGLFQRGDANNDGSQDISDGVQVLNHLFLGGAAPLCPSAADVNGDGLLNVSDPSFLFNHLFLGGPALPAPYPECGTGRPEESCPASACHG